MDTGPMVESECPLDTGAQLIRTLEQGGTKIIAAGWVKPVEEGRWNLLLAIKDIEERGLIAAYRTLADTLRQIGDSRISVSDVKLLSERSRAAQDLLEGQPKNARGPQRVAFTSVGGVPVERAYVYPPFQPLQAGARSSILRFTLRSTEHPVAVMGRFNSSGKNVLNRSEWRGKEPRSCMVTSVRGRALPAPASETVYDIEVTYKPKGLISYIGGTRYEGWTAVVADRAPDGTFLDGQGGALPEGQPPVYRRFEVFEDTDFNQIDFGAYTGETEIEGIRHLVFDDVMARFVQSRRMKTSLTSSFVTTHRYRPHVKLVISKGASEVSTDGFGTLIRAISDATPQLNQVVVDQVSEVVNGFVEGRYSISNTCNDEFVFVQLTDILVDCTPNAEGKQSRFFCVRDYLPETFLDDLAARLMATYDLEASAVDGQQFGLLLKRIVREW